MLASVWGLTTPLVLIRAIESSRRRPVRCLPSLVNQRAPSGPAVIPIGATMPASR